MTHRLTSFLVVALAALLVLPLTADAQILNRLKRELNKNKQDAQQAAQDEAARGVLSEVDRDQQRRQERLGLKDNAAAPLDAPHVRYRLTTTFDMGAAGAVTQLMGLDADPTWVSMSGLTKREDIGRTSTITDAEAMTITHLDHETKTYRVTSIAEAMEQARAQLEALRAQMDETETQAAEDAAGDYSFTVRVEHPEQTATINGVPATQHLIIVETIYEGEQPEDAEEDPYGGRSFTVTELWLTDQIAGYETMQAFDARVGAQTAAAMGPDPLALAPMMAGQDPRASAAFARVADEMEAMDSGLAIRTTMHNVVVPEDEELDLVAVFQEAQAARERPKGLAGLAQMAEDAEAQPADGAVRQQTVFRFGFDLSDLATDPIEASYYEVPADYTQVN